MALLGFIFGIAFLFKTEAARRGLIILSWVGCIYFFGSSIVGAGYSFMSSGVDHSFSSILFVLAVVAIIAVQGIPFLLMARKLTHMRCTDA